MSSTDYRPLSEGLPAVYQDDQESFAQLDSFLGLVDELNRAHLRRAADLRTWLSPDAPTLRPPSFVTDDVDAAAVGVAHAEVLDAIAQWFAFRFPSGWPTMPDFVTRRASMLRELARLWRERATPSGFVDFIALFFGLAPTERPLLVEHFTVAEEPGELAAQPPDRPPHPVADPWLTATLFVPCYPAGELKPADPEGLFARHESRRELIAIVDRYSPAHVDVRVCWVAPDFAAQTLRPPDPPEPGTLAGDSPYDPHDPVLEPLADKEREYRIRAREVLANLVSRVDHALGIRVWECIDEGAIDDRLGVGRLPTDP